MSIMKGPNQPAFIGASWAAGLSITTTGFFRLFLNVALDFGLQVDARDIRDLTSDHLIDAGDGDDRNHRRPIAIENVF